MNVFLIGVNFYEAYSSLNLKLVKLSKTKKRNEEAGERVHTM